MKIYNLFIGIILCVMLAPVQAEIISQEIKYQQGKTELLGYVAYDNSKKGKRPGILVVHEWWGHNDYARSRARQLAALGYVAFALDMYGNGTIAKHPKDAGRFANRVKNNMQVAEARFDAAIEQLKKSKFTDGDNIAAIGYCFGGGVALEMARRGKALKAVVSFHGSLGTDSPAVKDTIKAKLLVFNGAADVFVKNEAIIAFRQEMKAANVELRFVNLAEAKHSFTNPKATEIGKKFGIPLEYNKKADEASWQEMTLFFKGLFQ